MFIGSIIALTLSLSLLAFLIVLIIVQRVRANKAAQEVTQAQGEVGHVIPSNFIAPGATPPPNTPNRPRIIGKPVL